MVKDLLDKRGVKSRFGNNIPGDYWFQNFCKQNKMSKRASSNNVNDVSKSWVIVQHKTGILCDVVWECCRSNSCPQE